MMRSDRGTGVCVYKLKRNGMLNFLLLPNRSTDGKCVYPSPCRVTKVLVRSGPDLILVWY